MPTFTLQDFYLLNIIKEKTQPQKHTTTLKTQKRILPAIQSREAQEDISWSFIACDPLNFPLPDKLTHQGGCTANSSVEVSSLSIQTLYEDNPSHYSAYCLADHASHIVDFLNKFWCLLAFQWPNHGLIKFKFTPVQWGKRCKETQITSSSGLLIGWILALVGGHVMYVLKMVHGNSCPA